MPVIDPAGEASSTESIESTEADAEQPPGAEPAPGPAHGEARRRALIGLGLVGLVLLIAVLIRASDQPAAVPTQAGSTQASSSRASSTQAGSPQAGPAPVGSSRAPSAPASATPAPSARAKLPAGFHRIRSTAGLRLAIPDGWTARPVRNATAEQRADDPAHPLTFLQFGGYTTVHSTQLGRVRGYEAAKQRTGYVRLKLNPVTYGSAGEAVEWEYTFRADVELHAYGRYWRVGKREYVLYALAPQANWDETWDVLRNALNSAGPR